MKTDFLRSLKTTAWQIYRPLWRTKAITLRALVCWLIGWTVILLDDTYNYDQRFQLRGAQKPSSDIVLVLIGQDEWAELIGQSRYFLRPMKEFASISDSFFWHPETWESLLTQVLADKPKAIGVSYFFNPNLADAQTEKLKTEIFNHERVIWATRVDSDGRLVMPLFSNNYGYNTGLIEFRTDEDRVLRRFSSPLVQIPHISLRLAELSGRGGNPYQTGISYSEGQLINFQGARGQFAQVSARDVISNRLPDDFFHNKIVIIGSRDQDNHLFQTPLGEMSRAEVIANIVDNILEHRWISRLEAIWIALLLLAILIVSVWILISYPQTIAFVFLFWMGTGISALSLWIFDSYYFWTPIIAPMIQIAATYIIFLGYQLTQKENLSWRLEQEKKYLYEVEQLKNNFVSLISHDLKTPIAKIQAICDRLISGNNPDPEVCQGLLSLRKESDELHRYIQSILRISRVESSNFKINKEASDINDIIEKVVAQLSPLAQNKNQTLVTQLEPMFSIEIDSLLIYEVILNLVENAIKYGPSHSKIEIVSQEVDNQVIVYVQDQGFGIAKEDQLKIFDKFYRSESHKTDTKGSGLGLFLVKYFIELHHGQVFVESNNGQGAKIGFSLPVGEESAISELSGIL